MNEKKYAPNFSAKTDNCIVLRDGEEQFRGKNDECFIYILTHQGNSVHHATKYEGWECRDLDDEGNIIRP